MMNKVAQFGTLAVVAHVIVGGLHGLVHLKLQIPLTLFQNVFVVSVIGLAPIFAMLLLWTRFRYAGVLLLLSSMVGALTFGVYNHFVVVGPDHVSQVPPGELGMLFQVTAILVAVIEGLGCWVGVWALRTIHRA